MHPLVVHAVVVLLPLAVLGTEITAPSALDAAAPSPAPAGKVSGRAVDPGSSPG